MADPLPIRGIEYHAEYLSDRRRSPEPEEDESDKAESDSIQESGESSQETHSVAKHSEPGIGGHIDLEA